MIENVFEHIVTASDGSVYHHTRTKANGEIYTRPSETHDQYEVYCLIDGEIDYVIEGRSYHAEPGDILLLGKEEVHQLRVDLSKDYERVVFHFDESILPRSYWEKGGFFARLETTGYLSRQLKSEQVKQTVIPLLIKNAMQVLENENYQQERLLAISILLIAEINKMNSQKAFTEPYSHISDPIRKSLSYISDQLSEKITVDEVSKMAGLNPNYFSRLFKREMGMGFGEYVITKKMYQARRYIFSGDTASEAALKVGYTNYSSFFQSYKKIFGESPSKGTKER